VLQVQDSDLLIDNETIKTLQVKYFENIKFENSVLLGGSEGKEPGGVSSACLTANGRFLAIAVSAGAILIYETDLFELIRIYDFTKNEKDGKIVEMEFSADSCS